MGSRITAIITCKNREQNLKFCLASLAVCAPRPRTILVDFGSDPPLSYPGYKSWLNTIRVDRATEIFHKARAINIGIRAVKTPYLCILDADQIVPPDFFGTLDNLFAKHKNIFIMCRTYFLLRKLDEVTFDRQGTTYNRLLVEAKNSGIIPHGDGCCNGVTAKLAMNMHGYDETYLRYRAQDSDFAFRAVLTGLKKLWADNHTSMIHLPHQRVGEYYSQDYVVHNKKKYKQKTKLPASQIIIANQNLTWGQL